MTPLAVEGCGHRSYPIFVVSSCQILSPPSLRLAVVFWMPLFAMAPSSVNFRRAPGAFGRPQGRSADIRRAPGAFGRPQGISADSRRAPGAFGRPQGISADIRQAPRAGNR